MYFPTASQREYFLVLYFFLYIIFIYTGFSFLLPFHSASAPLYRSNPTASTLHALVQCLLPLNGFSACRYPNFGERRTPQVFSVFALFNFYSPPSPYMRMHNIDIVCNICERTYIVCCIECIRFVTSRHIFKSIECAASLRVPNHRTQYNDDNGTSRKSLFFLCVVIIRCVCVHTRTH
jgi:hypothetical protein